MPQPCQVCSHPDVRAIDEALVAGQATVRGLAETYGFLKSSLSRHRTRHLPELLLKAREIAERERADDLLEELRTIREDLRRLMRKAEEDGDYRGAGGACYALLKRVDLWARIEQLIDDRPQVNILIAPAVRETIVGSLEAYPEARLAVADALAELEEAAAEIVENESRRER